MCPASTITLASLLVKKVQVVPRICLGHMEVLFAANAKYPIDGAWGKRTGGSVY